MREQQVKHIFHGARVTTYAEYIDADRDRTLVAEPGQEYTIRPAEGVTRPGPGGEHEPVRLPVPPDDRWKPAPKPRQSTKEQT